MQQNNYKVYALFHLETDKIVYIGLTRRSLLERYNAHVQRKKFNRNHYGIKLISEELTIEQAVQLEKMLIKQYNLLINGWNKSPGSINGHSNYHSEKQKKLWSKNRKGKSVSPEHAAKNRTAQLGKKNSKEHANAIIEAISQPVMCLENGIIYKSQREAAKILGLHYSKISLVCNGKRKTTGGYHFIKINKSGRDRQK